MEMGLFTVGMIRRFECNFSIGAKSCNYHTDLPNSSDHFRGIWTKFLLFGEEFPDIYCKYLLV